MPVSDKRTNTENTRNPVEEEKRILVEKKGKDMNK